MTNTSEAKKEQLEQLQNDRDFLYEQKESVMKELVRLNTELNVVNAEIFKLKLNT